MDTESASVREEASELAGNQQSAGELMGWLQKSQQMSVGKVRKSEEVSQ